MGTERSKILQNIERAIIETKEHDLDEKVQEIDQIRDSSKMFTVPNMLKRIKFENPFVHNEKGENVTNPAEIYKIKKHFEN